MANFVGRVWINAADHGWVETYKMKTTAGYVQAKDDLESIIAARVELFNDTYNVVRYAVSDESILGDSLPSFADEVPEPGVHVDASTEPWTALQIELVDSTLRYKVRRYLHGIPQTSVSGKDYAPVAGFTTSLNLFGNELKSKTDLVVKKKDDPDKGSIIRLTINEVYPTKLINKHLGKPYGIYSFRRLPTPTTPVPPP